MLSAPAAAQKYIVLNSPLKGIEAPWLFDGKQVGKGRAINITDADTKENRHACATEWKSAAGYRALCQNLADLKIVSVRLADLNNHSVMLVPVSRIAKIASGDEVLIRMADISSDDVMRSLPVFLRVLPQSRQQGLQSLLDGWRRYI